MMSYHYKDQSDLDTEGVIKLENLDMPQDLSPKYKSVAVQTDNYKVNLEELLETFSQKQVQSLMSMLIQFAMKRDNESIEDKEKILTESFTKV